jgi:hypothetical protein
VSSSSLTGNILSEIWQTLINDTSYIYILVSQYALLDMVGKNEIGQWLYKSPFGLLFVNWKNKCFFKFFSGNMPFNIYIVIELLIVGSRRYT